MRLKTLILILSIGLVAFVMESCLKGDPTNFPEGSQHPFLIMTNNSSGAANNPISGLQYFGNQSLGYPHSDARDTATFYVALEGTGNASSELAISLVSNGALPSSVLKDNFSNDSITYLNMPDSLFTILNTTGVIAKGTAY